VATKSEQLHRKLICFAWNMPCAYGDSTALRLGLFFVKPAFDPGRFGKRSGKGRENDRQQIAQQHLHAADVKITTVKQEVQTGAIL